MEKIEALAKFLDCGVEDIELSTYDDNTYAYGNQEYLVLTDKEADEKAYEYIKDSLWAFKASFIMEHARGWKGMSHNACAAFEKAIRLLQEKECEGCNDDIMSMIENIGEFVDDAVSADGRGHFLAPYDFEENEEGEYFIYRIN